MAILYVASEGSELKHFASLLTGLRKLSWPLDYAYEGILEGRRVMLAANGAGPKLTIRAVEVAIRAISAAELSSSKLEAIVSVGFCGALDPSLKEYDVIVGSEVLDVATGERFTCEPVTSDRPFSTGLIATQDRIANDTAEKRALHNSGAVAVEMEAAAVAARSKRAALPFFCIKAVTDRADESFPLDLNEMRTIEGRIARGKIGVYAITHPRVVPGLIKFRKRAKEAAQALGDFLVSCRIKSDADTALAG